MMLADVGIAVVMIMKLVMNDASFFGPAKAGYTMQPAHNDESDSLTLGNRGIDMLTVPQLRRRQTGVSEAARYYW